MNTIEEIKKVLSDIGDGAPFSLSVPDDKTHGDIATNIAFSLSKKLGKSPKEVAGSLLPELKEKLAHLVTNVEVASIGFINFFLKPEMVRDASQNVGKITTKFTGKKVLVEHSSPNLFKPFHIGHLMNNIEGEFVTRAVRLGGADVTTLSFPSDVSLGVAKAMFILLGERKDGFLYENLEEEGQIIYFGECYVKGVAYFKEHEDALVEAKSLAHIIYDENHTSDIRITFLDIQKRSEHYFRNVVTSLGSHIDDYIYESEVSISGTKIVKEAIGTIFRESEGAVIYEPGEERKDLHTAVFINGEGHPTYEAKDIGLIAKKFDTHNPDISFTVTDVEQTQHFKIVFDAASKLGGDWMSRVEKSIHVPHGRMLFKGQKMSSRLGGVPLALDVIGAVEEEVRERAGERLASLREDERGKITREIALSALRIAVLRSRPGLNINFDPETSLSFEGDSGPYLLYTHARCFSLLEKGQGEGVMPSFNENVEPSSLERTLFHFNSVLKESIEDIAPQKLVTFLFKVAQEFNSFYGSVQIITEDKEKSAHNLAIVSWAKEVLREGLYMLGIRAVERM